MEPLKIQQKALKAYFAIQAFIIFYIILILLAFSLTIACFFGGIALLSVKVGWLTIVLALGLIGMGLLVFFFVIKFVFKKHVTDLSGMIEITAKEEPKLFNLILELSKEIDTQFPKKVYLTPDVNAFVFYDSSFWSMFLPIRKNLAIGTGLVNTMTDVELKAIISHEFGHFSQKTMKTGSYVYFVNQIIYHQINENSSFENVVNQFANISNYFAIFAWLGVKIVVVIQRALGEFYQIVNRYYLDLSREMEFQADEIAAKVVGSESLVTALLRLDLASQAYANAVDFYGQRQSEKAITDNIFLCQTYVLKALAQENKIDIKGEIPLVTKEHITRFNRSHLVIKDQWASHPTTLERVNRLHALGIEKETAPKSAWTLFENEESTQLKITKTIFEIYKGKLGNTRNIQLDEFIVEYEKENDKYRLNAEYNGFYDDREIYPFDIEEVVKNIDKNEIKSIQELYNENSIDQKVNQQVFIQDIQNLQIISNKSSGIKTFELDGKRHNYRKANSAIQFLEKKKKKVDDYLNALDEDAFCFFYSLAKQKNEESHLVALYQTYFENLNILEKDKAIHGALTNSLQFLNVVTPPETIKINFNEAIPIENDIKERLTQLIGNQELVSLLNGTILENINRYLGQKWKYFIDESYQQDALEVLYSAISSFQLVAWLNLFLSKKKLLSYQVSLTSLNVL